MYGRLTAYPLTLEPGSYELIFANAAWKGSPVYQVNILSSSGSTVKTSATYTAAPNIDGNAAGNISKAERYTLAFDVKTKGKYIIQFKDKTTSGGFHEFLLAECRLRCISLTGISEVSSDEVPESYFDLNGRSVGRETKGLLIRRTADGKTHKEFNK